MSISYEITLNALSWPVLLGRNGLWMSGISTGGIIRHEPQSGFLYMWHVGTIVGYSSLHGWLTAHTESQNLCLDLL